MPAGCVNSLILNHFLLGCQKRLLELLLHPPRNERAAHTCNPRQSLSSTCVGSFPARVQFLSIQPVPTFLTTANPPSHRLTAQNNHMDKVNEPQYVISLKTEKPGGQKGDVQMSCTLAQLQDLVGKLKNACKGVESLAG